jgi:hypothetical protein
MFGNKKEDLFVRIGFWLDLVGFFIAWFLFWPGVAIMLIALVISVIGLLRCIQAGSGVVGAVIYIVLDVAFLIGLFVFW